METTGTTRASSTPGTGAQGSNGRGETVISSDFETFLKMMTTQLENQDPLNPLDSAEFAVQLATFSNVEQQVRTNVLLEELGAQIGLSGMSEMAGFVGMETRVKAPARFTGAPVELSIDLAEGADGGVLVVKDEAGTELQRLAVDTGARFHLWNGADDQGVPFAPGNYSFEVESYEDDEVIDVSQAEVYARVEEARLEKGATVLLLDSGVTVPADSVTALRYPVIYEEDSAG